MPKTSSEQVPLGGAFPLPGEVWRHRIRGEIACVLHVRHAVRVWVTVRANGKEREHRLDSFRAQYQRVTPAGHFINEDLT